LPVIIEPILKKSSDQLIRQEGPRGLRGSLAVGIGPNLAQFALLVGVNGLVGALVGQERSLVPLLGSQTFGIRSATTGLAFVGAFGLAKAFANLAAGAAADRLGRKPVLVAGWLLGVPVPLILMLAPSWSWVVAANLLLGVSQGLAWSSTVIMKIDLAGPQRRGLAAGVNEFAGYLAVALSAGASGFIAARYGLRPQPFFLGLAVAGLGLGLSALVVRETRGHAQLEAKGGAALPFSMIWRLGSYQDRPLAALSRTGLVNNANDALAWGLLPILFFQHGLDPGRIGFIAGLYPATWAVVQLLTGPLSDRFGRRPIIAAGMWTQAVALLWFVTARSFASWSGAAVLLGVGTALVYPALLAAVGDHSGPAWRAGATGVYRFWRDAGYLIGALVTGLAADLAGIPAAIGLVAALTALAGLDAWINLAARRGRFSPVLK
jgi:MFS family permease